MNRWLLALGAWTLFVWANRINNILGDGDVVAWKLAVALVFTLAGVGVIGLVLTHQDRIAAGVASALAVAGILWWPPRAIMTLFDDFSMPFKIVHTVLATVTVGLGLLVLGQLKVRSSRYG